MIPRGYVPENPRNVYFVLEAGQYKKHYIGKFMCLRTTDIIPIFISNKKWFEWTVISRLDQP